MSKQLFLALTMLMTASISWATVVSPHPDESHSTGNWLVLIDAIGEEQWFQLYLGTDGTWSTILSLDYATYGGYRPGIDPERLVRTFFVNEGIVLGPQEVSSIVLGSINFSMNPLYENGKSYTLYVGATFWLGFYNYNGNLYAFADIGGYGHDFGDPAEYADYSSQGDADRDNDVTIADMTAVIDFLLDDDDTAINLYNADCDLDGSITVTDVTTLIDYLLTGNW